LAAHYRCCAYDFNHPFLCAVIALYHQTERLKQSAERYLNEILSHIKSAAADNARAASSSSALADSYVASKEVQALRSKVGNAIRVLQQGLVERDTEVGDNRKRGAAGVVAGDWWAEQGQQRERKQQQQQEQQGAGAGGRGRVCGWVGGRPQIAAAAAGAGAGAAAATAGLVFC
jgi:hypothetical protein